MQRKEFIRRRFRTLKGKEFQVTYCKITGSAPGPVLTLIAGQHGMEHSGPNILTQFIEDINPDDFKGTLYVCPCANPLALEVDYEIYPETEDMSKLDDYYYSRFRHTYCPFGLGRIEEKTWYNMNRLWNRDKIHGVAGRIADWLWNEMCIPADVVIDMHCLQDDKPLIYNGNPINNSIAKYFGIEGIYMTNPEPDDYSAHNMLYQVNNALGAVGFCVEFSIQHGLKESEYQFGTRGVHNVMKAMHMLDGEIIHDRPVWIVPYESQIPLRAENTGHIRYFFDQYDQVKKGQKLYEIRDIQTLELVEEGFSPIDGVVGRKNHIPVMKPGEIPTWVADAELAAPAGTALEKLPCNYFQ
jgi:predicted deacylase